MNSNKNMIEFYNTSLKLYIIEYNLKKIWIYWQSIEDIEYIYCFQESTFKLKVMSK